MTVVANVKTTLRIRKSNGQFATVSSASGRAEATLLKSALGSTEIGDLDRLAKSMNTLEFSVGFAQDSYHSGAKMPSAALAAMLEFGTRHIPPRPYLQKAGAVVAPSLSPLVRKALQNLSPERNPRSLTSAQIKSEFISVAQEGARRTQSIIYKGPSLGIAPNAPSTLRQKAGSAPWVDKGELVASLTGFVRLKS